MLSSEEIYNKRLYITNKKDRVKRHGNLRAMVFHPSKPRAVGFMVKRPDAAMMVKRKDRFVAIDRITKDEEGHYFADLGDDSAWDKGAAKRLGVDLDECIIWWGHPVVTPDGEEIGYISDIAIDEETYEVDHIDISENTLNRKILGSADIPVDKIRGYKDGAIVADVRARDVEVSGGAAAKAGEAWAKGSHAVGQAEDVATEKAVEVIEKSGEVAGKAAAKVATKAKKVMPADAESAGLAAGKHLRKVGGMFSAFKEEYDKASK